MAIELNRDDFNRLVILLAAMPEMGNVYDRQTLVQDIFAGSPARSTILSLIRLDGNPRTVSIGLITRLNQYGQDEPGQETLGVLINHILSYLGSGEDAEFLRGLFRRYPLQTEPVASKAVDTADWRGRETDEDVKERLIGENTLREVLMLELAHAASKAVVRIVGPEIGSGFLCGERLVMTCNHVINSPAQAAASRFEFYYELDSGYKPRPMVTSRAVPDGLFYTNPDLDFSVVEIETVPDGVEPLKLLPCRSRRDARVNIIQHPGGHYKKFSMQNNFVAFADGRDLQYLTTTEPGSSGSPVMDDMFEVLGIHHSGGNLLEPGSNRRHLRNAGSSMIAVLEDIQKNSTEIYQKLRRG